MKTVPVNFQKQDNGAEALRAIAEYEVSVADSLIPRISRALGLPSSPMPLRGLRLLEIGPGPALGAAVTFACAGATVAVADRFLAAWDPDFHPAFFGELHRVIAHRGDAFMAPLRRLIEARSFAAVLECYPLPAEHVSRIPGTFDVVLSNAVLEHVLDIDGAAAAIATKTAASGIGIHQVDFRDHRDFSRPLEFLTLDEAAFDALRRETACQCGGRWRASDVARAFTAAGLSVSTTVGLVAEPDYLADVRGRLHSHCAGIEDTDLAALGATFTTSRNAGTPETAMTSDASQPASGATPDDVSAFFGEAAAGVGSIAGDVQRVASLFRDGSGVAAHEALAVLPAHIRQFIVLVTVVDRELGHEPARFALDGLTPSQQIARLGGWLQSLVTAQADDDALTIADILEYDLHPFLEAWSAMLTKQTAAPTLAGQ